jgi:hypothetical protein
MTWYSLDRNELLQSVEPIAGYGRAYVGRDDAGVYYEDSNRKLYVNDLMELIKHTKAKKYRSEYIKIQNLESYNNILAIIRHYRVEFLLDPKPIMTPLDYLALAC